MPTTPVLARSASARRRTVLVLVVGLAVLGGCGGSGGSSAPSTSPAPPSSAAGTRTTTRTPVTIFESLPPPTIPAGGCAAAPRSSTATVTVTVDDKGFSPQCVTVATTQTLRLHNVGRQFHNAVVEDLSSNLPAGGTQVWDELGQYLAPGHYLLYSATQLNPRLFPGFHTTLVVEGR